MKRKKTKSYWVEDTPEKLDYINQTLYEENMKLNKELAKYKKALKIIKKYLNIELVYDDDGCEPTWFLDSNCGREIEQEEYKLLEELMKDAKD